MFASSMADPSRFENTCTVVVPAARCQQAWVSLTLSMSSRANSPTLRCLHFTIRRKSVNVYAVPGRHHDTGNRGDEDHNTCSHGSGNIASVFTDVFPIYAMSKKRDKERKAVHALCSSVGVLPIQ